MQWLRTNVLNPLEGSEWLEDMSYEYGDGRDEFYDEYYLALETIRKVMMPDKEPKGYVQAHKADDGICNGGEYIYRELTEHNVTDGLMRFRNSEAIVVCSTCEHPFEAVFDADGLLQIGRSLKV